MLDARGYEVVDTDTDQWSRWTTVADGSRDWVWREQAMEQLLDEHVHGRLFVAGCKSNQGKFYAQFEHIALLRAPASVLLARVAARTENPYGKTPEEQAPIPHHLAVVEPLLRATATIEIDATAPIDDVVRRLERLP